MPQRIDECHPAKQRGAHQRWSAWIETNRKQFWKYQRRNMEPSQQSINRRKRIQDCFPEEWQSKEVEMVEGRARNV